MKCVDSNPLCILSEAHIHPRVSRRHGAGLLGLCVDYLDLKMYISWSNQGYVRIT